MHPTSRNVLLASVTVLAATWGLVRISSVGAQEELKAARSARGGLLAKTARHQFEVFFYPTGVRVLVETASGQPVDASRASGTATFYHPNSPQPWFSRPLNSTAQAGLEFAIGLGNAPATGGKVTIELSGRTARMCRSAPGREQCRGSSGTAPRRDRECPPLCLPPRTLGLWLLSL